MRKLEYYSGWSVYYHVQRYAKVPGVAKWGLEVTISLQLTRKFLFK